MKPAAALSYGVMRQQAFRRALKRALRRWGLFGLVAALAAGVGSNDPLGAATSLPVLLAWPLHRALAAGDALQVAAWVAASALAGLLPLVLTRRWWWPPRWAEAERALPLDPAELRRSDRRVVRQLVLPWHGLTAVGLLLPLAVTAGGSRAGVAAGAFVAWGLALAGSLVLGQRWLAQLRRAGTGSHRGRQAPPRAAARAHGRWFTWWWLPLRRGAARGTARLLLVFGLVEPALAAGPAVVPQATGWWLAALSLVVLAGTSLLRVRVAADWAGWRAAAAAWPWSPTRLDAQARTLVLLPAFAATAVLVLAGGMLALAPVAPRAGVALAYAVALPLAGWIEAHPPAADATHQAVRWLLMAALLVALGSEVMP